MHYPSWGSHPDPDPDPGVRWGVAAGLAGHLSPGPSPLTSFLPLGGVVELCTVQRVQEAYVRDTVF